MDYFLTVVILDLTSVTGRLVRAIFLFLFLVKLFGLSYVNSAGWSEVFLAVMS